MLFSESPQVIGSIPVREILLYIRNIYQLGDSSFYTGEVVGSKPTIPTCGLLDQVVDRGANNAKVMGSNPIWTKRKPKDIAYYIFRRCWNSYMTPWQSSV